VNAVNIAGFVKIRLKQILDETRNRDAAPSRSCDNRRAFPPRNAASERMQRAARHAKKIRTRIARRNPANIFRQTVDNRRRMIAEVPHVDFYVSATISSMNVLHVPDFHREWVELGLIKPKDFNINICQSPDHYRLDVFPEDFKNRVIIPKLREHVRWLIKDDDLKRATNGYMGIINFLNGENKSERWVDFVRECGVLDHIRAEDFWTKFPEYAELKNYEPA
jgi:hypothetical protein